MGITERTAASIPRWLAIAFLIIPAFGLLYLAGGSSAAGGCSDSDVVLSADFMTGALQNCDGSAFEGRATGGRGAAQFLAIGQAEFQTCAACHGANGEGGVGPAFAGVTSTFSSCADHIEWVRLGTNGFRAAGRTTYGDLAKPVGGVGVMPSFASLSQEQLASVVAFERIRFGGGNPDEVLVDCGLVQPPSTDGSTPTDGTTPPTTSAASAELSRPRG